MEAKSDRQIQVTPAAVRAGLRTLSIEYNDKFDAMENDARHFVTRLFEAMLKAQHQSPGQVVVEIESKS